MKEILTSLKKRELKNKKITVLGSGKSGIESSKFLSSLGATVLLSDNKELEKSTIDILNQYNIPYEMGYHSKEAIINSDLIIVSPGIPIDSDVLKLANTYKIPFISEIELAYLFTEIPIIAITGSNGKTTTTSLISYILEMTDKKVGCCGNIGIPYVSLVSSNIFNTKKYEYYVIEISSFQLETIRTFKPYIGVLLNLNDNHLDRHKTREIYRNMKKRLFENQTEMEFAVLNSDYEDVISIKDEIKSKVIQISMKKELEQGVFLFDNYIVSKKDNKLNKIIQIDKISLKGKHNLENCLAAVAVMEILNISNDIVEKSLKEFTGVEHRIEPVSIIQGVTFINDSKGTNYTATIKAIESFNTPIILILGGRDKGGDFSPLAKIIKEKVDKVILIGETQTLFEKYLRSSNFDNIYYSDSLKGAVELSYKLARSGDTVLFSPACTSFDMFKNFEERGNFFKNYVRELTKN